jgi:hypothetical protein
MRVGVEGPQSSVKTAEGANPDVPTLRMQACDEPPTRATLVAELSVVVFASAVVADSGERQRRGLCCRLSLQFRCIGHSGGRQREVYVADFRYNFVASATAVDDNEEVYVADTRVACEAAGPVMAIELLLLVKEGYVGACTLPWAP